MYEVTRMLYDSYKPYVFTVYYTYGPVTELTFDARTCILQIPGSESFVPGILEKTWSALQWASQLEIHYDYVVRSNISTVVNFQNLEDALRVNPIDYGGCHVLTLAWLDEAGGIVDSSLLGTRFASGTCIIWSAPCVSRLVQHGDVDTSIIDDVSIALTMQRLGYQPFGFDDRFYFYSTTPMWSWHPQCVHRVDGVPDAEVEAELQIHGPTAIAFRHRVHEQNRLDDIPFLARTVRYVLKWNHRLY